MQDYAFSILADGDGTFASFRLDPAANGVLIDVEVIFGAIAPNLLAIQLVSMADIQRPLTAGITASQYLDPPKPLALPPGCSLTFSGNTTPNASAVLIVYFI